ncbi:hypothetical protein [Caulobacter sp. RHG1]|uniref:hypothetical protein n=1 Tax=Caulobacter sp. (strain RHG1) TaxID=2545762 RepID=UPI001556E2C3|nr:hypothetical protein [Caulobacter sp. RHG1]NQE62169.1 hypothetical protein [Caulobacter sp. RHG1]
MKAIALAFLLLTSCIQEFDAQRWRGADLSTRLRAEMVDSLTRTYSLKGMTRGQITALLGPPTRTDKWRDAEMVYVLGPNAGMPIDHDWLLLDVDAADRVTGYRVVSD